MKHRKESRPGDLITKAMKRQTWTLIAAMVAITAAFLLGFFK
jgi:hypothetical protein